ncbi:sigma-70 family RNA polymerase sigma factor [Romboutsia sp. CE17]|uniref:sigma-70 family RNA polymerase sigma factor n=1 Tax=Romboutsia sp. CE17 TaxID=2724150 RepID=UPI001442AFF1|nr:sigma-70 family RNA polymerase sigma factor [Romboutsia sp. CE17]QJA10009.1 sigma-70 family RNA polymerase sigma factor [Romboutsia sp. CE17]
MQDELIIKYIKKKKEKGMELLIDNYRGIITAIVRRHLGVLINYEEECVDDVLLSIWDNIKSFDNSKNSFKNWICAISKYKAIDYKKKYLSKIEYMDMSETIYYIDEQLLKSEIEEEVNDILSHLNESDRTLFKQHYLEGHTLKEIAFKHNISVSNIYNRISRGRKKIRERISK